MDGTVLADAMTGSSATARKRQRTKQAELQPVVSALKAQSRIDLLGR
jgi:hypothetical protein